MSFTQSHIVTAAKALAAIPSTADNLPALQQAVDYIAGLLAGTPGITVERFEHNGKPSLLAYRGSVRPARFAILLNGHVDVVPGQPHQFRARVENGKLYGRGVHDMKTAAVIMAGVFCDMVHAVPYELGLQIVSDEEVGGYDGVVHQLQQGVQADFAVIGEHNFSPNVIYNAARGLCWIEVAFAGQTAHGGYVWHGSNAVVKASTFAQAVLQHYPVPDAEFWGTTANIAGIYTGNETFNRIPDNAVVKIDFRFTAEDDNFKDRASVEAFVRSIDPDATILGFHTMEQAVHVPESNPYLQTLARALQQTTHIAPQFQSRFAGSDGRHLQAAGCDVVEFGVMGHGPHSDEEYVEIAQLLPYQQTLKTFLQHAQQQPATRAHDAPRAKSTARSRIQQTA